MRNVILGMLAFMLGGIHFTFASSKEKVKVISVYDGNSLEVINKKNQKIKIYLYAVDCPEPKQDYGQEAKRYTERQVLNKRITIKIKGKDKEGNLLAVVYLGKNKTLNGTLLKKGYAWYDKNISSYADKFYNMALDAKLAKTGLWESENPTPPWVFKKERAAMIAKTR